ncbi:MAG: hypothetical protein O2807_06485 [bacterium]|nr:hypothetical protein [bacterium]
MGLGDWDFANWWWWKPILDPLFGLIWLIVLAGIGVAIYAFIGSRTKMSDYRAVLMESDAPAPRKSSDEKELAGFMDAYFPEVSEREILRMQEILDEVLSTDIHPEMMAEIERREIPVHLVDLPAPAMVKEVGGWPLAVWIPATQSIEIYAAPMKMHCGGDADAYRGYMGNLLLHEMGHALGLGETKLKDFGV